MYTHDKNKPFSAYLKRKAAEPDADQREADYLPVIDYKEPNRVQVFDVEHLGTIKDAHSKSSNQYKNIYRVLTQLEGTEGYLQLVELPESILDDLDALAIRFPNFSGVIDYYKQEFALSRLTDNPIFTAQPLLIYGPHGVGKTLFCYELSKIVNTHFEFVSMSSLTAGFVLSGSSSKWGESGIGKVAQSFAHGKRANPLIVLDEVDKVSGDKRYDPLGSLYSLLEKETAAKFIDEALEVPIDASHVIWVATANYLNRIPEPIVSRFTIIEVSSPCKEEMPKILNSVYTKILQQHNWGMLFRTELSDAVVNKLIATKVEPRLLQKILISACGRAVLRTSANSESLQSKLEITVDDLNIHKNIGQSKLPAAYKGNIKDDNKAEIVIMPIFNIPVLSSDQNSEETMILWAVYEISDRGNKYRHLVGYVPDRQTGRVTSAIKHFDKNSMRLKTESGRVYKLDGEPALKDEMRPVWTEWKNKYHVDNDIDVTHQYITAH